MSILLPSLLLRYNMPKASRRSVLRHKQPRVFLIKPARHKFNPRTQSYGHIVHSHYSRIFNYTSIHGNQSDIQSESLENRILGIAQNPRCMRPQSPIADHIPKCRFKQLYLCLFCFCILFRSEQYQFNTMQWNVHFIDSLNFPFITLPP